MKAGATIPRDPLALPSRFDWSALMDVVTAAATGVPWWIGDLLNQGTPDQVEQWVEACTLDPATVRDWLHVAERFPQGRRRESLSWEHHLAVVALPPAVADDLLDQAEDLGSTTYQLRRAVSQARREATTMKLGNTA